MSYEYAGFGRRWLADAWLPPRHQRAAVAWSGGADSTALLLALKSAGYDVMAWHIDHGWRRDSAAQAKALAELAREWGIPFRTARLQAGSSANLEARAREDRYRQFAAWGEELGIVNVCLGHQRDDQAETVCLRLLQGAGPAGCRGMMPRRRHRNLMIFRPLLHVSAAELRAALRRIGVQWIEDQTNQDVRFRRNKVRHYLFPAMRKAGCDPVALFLRWRHAAERVTDRLDRQAQGLLAHLEDGDGPVYVHWRDWVDAGPPVRARVLQLMMRHLFGEGVTPGRRHIVLAEAWTMHGGFGGLDLSRCRLRRRKGLLHLEPVTADLTIG